jgi:hypothetical protein
VLVELVSLREKRKRERERLRRAEGREDPGRKPN